MRAYSDASVLPSATVGWSFEMVAQKAGGVLDGTWGWQRGCRSSGKEAWGSTEASLHRGLLLTVPKLLAPANILLVRTCCRFRKVARSEPGPAPSTVPGTLSVSTGIWKKCPPVCSSFSGCACTTIVLHPRIMLLVSLKCHSSPSSTTRFKWMHRSADACQSIETPMPA